MFHPTYQRAPQTANEGRKERSEKEKVETRKRESKLTTRISFPPINFDSFLSRAGESSNKRVRLAPRSSLSRRKGTPRDLKNELTGQRRVPLLGSHFGKPPVEVLQPSTRKGVREERLLSHVSVHKAAKEGAVSVEASERTSERSVRDLFDREGLT